MPLSIVHQGYLQIDCTVYYQQFVLIQESKKERLLFLGFSEQRRPTHVDEGARVLVQDRARHPGESRVQT